MRSMASFGAVLHCQWAIYSRSCQKVSAGAWRDKLFAACSGNPAGPRRQLGSDATVEQLIMHTVCPSAKFHDISMHYEVYAL